MLDMIAGVQVYENMEARDQCSCLSLLLSTILLLLFCLSVCFFWDKDFYTESEGCPFSYTGQPLETASLCTSIA